MKKQFQNRKTNSFNDTIHILNNNTLTVFLWQYITFQKNSLPQSYIPWAPEDNQRFLNPNRKFLCNNFFLYNFSLIYDFQFSECNQLSSSYAPINDRLIEENLKGKKVSDSSCISIMYCSKSFLSKIVAWPKVKTPTYAVICSRTLLNTGDGDNHKWGHWLGGWQPCVLTTYYYIFSSNAYKFSRSE